MTKHPTINRLISIQEAATCIGLSPHTLYTMVSQRRIPFVKVGRLALCANISGTRCLSSIRVAGGGRSTHTCMRTRSTTVEDLKELSG